MRACKRICATLVALAIVASAAAADKEGSIYTADVRTNLAQRFVLHTAR